MLRTLVSRKQSSALLDDMTLIGLNFIMQVAEWSIQVVRQALDQLLDAGSDGGKKESDAGA
jgi:hypothetical protein